MVAGFKAKRMCVPLCVVPMAREFVYLGQLELGLNCIFALVMRMQIFIELACSVL